MGEPLRWPIGWMGLALMADTTRDTAAAMLVALRAAELSCQPLAVGLADALDELVDRTANECDSRKSANVVHEATIQSIINHLRANNLRANNHD